MIRSKLAFLLLAACAAYSQNLPHADHAMGFSQEKTTHHFRLYRDGGAIEVTANDSKDAESRDQIQMHLGHIVTMFAAGDFNIPMLVHDKTPPGSEKMAALKSDIKYTYEKLPTGGRIRIVTKNAEALSAIHEFLRFQITDHHTGDPLR